MHFVNDLDSAHGSEASAIGALAAKPGAYVLVLRLAEPRTVTIGRLGAFTFAAGFHLYVGSAHGPGGLRGRLRHHLTPVTRPHWHVDYLRAVAPCVELWYAPGGDHCECVWAAALAALPGARSVAPRFGASDCGCAGHLVSFIAPPAMGQFARRAGAPALQTITISAQANPLPT